MTVDIILLWILLPVVGTLITIIGRGIMARVEILEQRMLTRVSEENVRTIVSDKLDPLKDDIVEIKEVLKQILLSMRTK